MKKKQNNILETILKKNVNKWLITGVAGFIGSNILEQLLMSDQKVVGIDNLSTGSLKNLSSVEKSVGKKKWKNFSFIKGDLADLKICNKIIKNVDIVIHQAARGSIPRSIKDPISTNKDNITSFLNILTVAKDNNIKSFVYASSSSVYGDSKKLPKIENKVGTVLSNYALTKKVNEEYARLFYQLYNFKTIGLRYFNVFGKRQNPKGDYAAVIPKWIDKAKNNQKIVIFGDGKTSRDFCPVQNVVVANILAGIKNLKKKNYIFNVGTGSRINLNKLAKTIYSLSNTKVSTHKIIYKNFRQGDIKHSLSKINNIKKTLKYIPSTSFKEGLKITINWFKDN